MQHILSLKSFVVAHNRLQVVLDSAAGTVTHLSDHQFHSIICVQVFKTSGNCCPDGQPGDYNAAFIVVEWIFYDR